MRRLAAVLLATVSLAAIGQAEAADTVQAKAQIRVVGYSATRRTEIVGVIGQPTTITFPNGEHIYRVVQTSKLAKDGSLGDAGWQGASPADVKDTPLGNNLTLWPAVPGETTMTVITETSTGIQRVYPFRLIARPAGDGAVDEPGVTLNLIFKGGMPMASAASASSDPPGEAHPRGRRHKPDPNELEEAQLRLRTDSFNQAVGQCHYVAKGVRPNPLEPRCPMSNGQWVLMRFPGLSKKPAVYIVGKDDSERLARQHGSEELVVVEEIAAHFRLRLGQDVLDVLDTAYDPVGNPTNSGTIAPSVDRQILQARQP